MHFQAPTHDTRRGSSRYHSAPGYDAADGLADRAERALALDAVRAQARRDERSASNIPTPHQLAAALSDALAYALHDPGMRDAIALVMGRPLRLALKARGFDPKNRETKRLLVVRLRTQERLLEVEARERVAAEVAAMAHRRRQATMDETIALLDALRDDEMGGEEAY